MLHGAMNLKDEFANFIVKTNKDGTKRHLDNFTPPSCSFTPANVLHLASHPHFTPPFLCDLLIVGLVAAADMEEAICASASV